MPPTLADLIRHWLDAKDGQICNLPMTPRIQEGGHERTCGAEQAMMDVAQITIAIAAALKERVMDENEWAAYQAFVGTQTKPAWKVGAAMLRCGKSKWYKWLYGDGDKKGFETVLAVFLSEKLGRTIL